MMNKNPYEVRLDVLKLAQEMLDREHQTKEHVFFAKLETLRSSTVDPNVINSFIETEAPKMYDPQEVLARSTELYSFVTSKKE